jgi:glutamyl/glutaminyl-tRNA synthetase
MSSDASAEAVLATVNPFTAADVEAILREQSWLTNASELEPNAIAALQSWLARAAELLGPQSADREALAKLLQLVFSYDAAAVLREQHSQEVLSRSGARDIIRELANRVLEGGEIESDRFKEIVEGMKAVVAYRSRAMFQPIRMALAGQTGEGELDRVILLLDSAARLNFAVPVKGTRQRMLEFCAALD